MHLQQRYNLEWLQMDIHVSQCLEMMSPTYIWLQSGLIQPMKYFQGAYLSHSLASTDKILSNLVDMAFYSKVSYSLPTAPD